MDQEELFTEELEELRAYAKEKGEVTMEDVRGVFAHMALDDEQLKLIFAYVLKQITETAEDPAETGKIKERGLSAGDSRYLSLYLKELEGLEKLSDGKKRALFMGAMNGERAAKDALITGLLTQVVDIARLYSGQGIALEDLIGEGNVALAVSMDVIEQEEDPKEAEEMVAGMIMRAMEELVNEDSLSKDAFETWAERANTVLDKARELSEDRMRRITVEELCSEAGFEKEFVREVIDVTGGKIEFLDLEIKDDGRNGPVI